ncbi:MAG: sigma-70 family RNA polymerase sigma factor [Terriglobales bacterium]
MGPYSSFSSDDLVKACAGSKNPAAWEEFIRRFHPVVARVVLRTARRWGETSCQVLDDLIQETYLKLCEDDSRLLRSFQPRFPDAIFGFLKVVAANVVHDHYKSALAEKRGAGRTGTLSEAARPASASPSLGNFDAMERHIFLQQVDEVLTRSAAGEEQTRNRAIFWLHYQHGLSASGIASLPSMGLTTKGVESTILRMTRMIRSHMLESRGSPARQQAEGEGFERAKSL